MNIAELSRLIENIVRVGEIAQADPAVALVRVKTGEITTDWLPYFVPAAGAVSIHRLPSVGEACVILSPSGNTAAGMVLTGYASNQFPSPDASADKTVIQFQDGARAEYDGAGNMLLSGMKTVTIDAPQTTCKGKLTVEGLFTYQNGMTGTGGSAGGTVITGEMNIKGEVTHSHGSMISNGITAHSHTHRGDSGGQTGGPQ